MPSPPDFHSCLLAQAQLHPAMQPQDALKLCFQAAHGAEHLIDDKNAALDALRQEFERTRPAKGLVWEAISPHYARVNLAGWKALGFTAEGLFQLFLQSAASPQAQDADAFQRCLDAVGAACQAGALPFSSDAWGPALEGYLRQGGGPLHHSQRYRLAEQPHYRVVLMQLLLDCPERA